MISIINFQCVWLDLANKIIQNAKLGFKHFWTKFSKKGYSESLKFVKNGYYGFEATIY